MGYMPFCPEKENISSIQDKKMPKYLFKYEKCGKEKDEIMSFADSEWGLTCKCFGHMERQFVPTKSIIGCNPYIRKRGLDPVQDNLEAMKSLEARKHKRLNKGGIL
jgi:hypothetical protein